MQKDNLICIKKSAISKKKEIVKEKEKKKQFLVRLSKEKKINNLLREELVHSSKKLNYLISRLENKIAHGEGLDINDKKGAPTSTREGEAFKQFWTRAR